ncbi:MAG: MGMT family protein [Patescibacteria group bacterium]
MPEKYWTQKKDWIQKIKDGSKKDLPKVVEIKDEKGIKRWGGRTLAIPAPIEVWEIMKKVPKGKLITTNEIRAKIAKKYKAEVGCPLTCGIFSWMAAYAGEQERAEGKKNITPYWRTLKSGGILNPKYPCGLPKMKKMLEAEGHKVIKKGKNYLVQDFEKKLVKI